MTEIDRKDFCNISPYEDSPQGIGFNATISAPHMHAFCLDLLEPYLKENSTVLDVGCGSGYLTACLAKMVPNGRVVGIEHLQGLADLSIRNISKSNHEMIETERVRIIFADGRKGVKGEVFDAIHVGAAAPKLPESLVEQLASPGRMIIPVGTYVQALYIVDKDADGKVSMKQAMGILIIINISRCSICPFD